MRRLANRHVVVFVTMRGPALRARSMRARRIRRCRRGGDRRQFPARAQIVFERMERLGMHCLDVAAGELPVALINRYLMIKQRGLI